MFSHIPESTRDKHFRAAWIFFAWGLGTVWGALGVGSGFTSQRGAVIAGFVTAFGGGVFYLWKAWRSR